MTKTLTPEGAEKIAGMGWDGAAWHKLPMVWGYSTHFFYRAIDESATAGDNLLAIPIPPAGEVWTVTQLAAMNTITVCTRISFVVRAGGVDYYLCGKDSPAAGEVVSLASHIILGEGDQLRGYYEGCVAADDIYLYASGYKMKVAE